MRTRPSRPARTLRSSRLVRLAPAAVAVTVSSALILSVGPGAVAGAARVVTGHDIADRSVKGRDLARDAIGSRHLRDRSVKGRHVKAASIGSRALRDGAITRQDLAPALRQTLDQAAGGAGSAPAPGPAAAATQTPPTTSGPASTASNVDEWEVATWTFSRAGDGSTSFQRTSADSLPAHAVVEALALDVTGDLSACDDYMSSLDVRTASGTMAGVASYRMSNGSVGLYQTRLAAAPTQLRVAGECWLQDGVTPPMGSRREPLPDVTVTLTFRWTVPDRTTTRSFD
jgi:hypothetical protein